MTWTRPPSPLALLTDMDAGRTSPERVFESYAERIAARAAGAKCFAHLELAAARAALPERIRGRMRGLPIGIKDIFDTVDMPTAYGSALYAGHRPGWDASVVVAARQAGLSLVGKTVTTPFANLDPTACENPRAPGRTPGGSSSGSAAAVAGGFVPFAIGSQTGGSTVRPGAYCGIVGFKPSFKLIPTAGMKGFSWNLDTVGLFAPTVADVALLAEAVTGRPLRVDRETTPSALRVGLLDVPGMDLAEPEMLDGFARARRLLERAGAAMIDLGAPAELLTAWDLHATLQNYEGARTMAHDLERFSDAIPPLVLSDIRKGTEISHDAYDEARGAANRARRAVSRLFEHVDVILQPAAPGAPPNGLGSTGRALFNRLWTLTGDPALSVPGLTTGDGLPLGLQVTGPFGEDHATLRAAAWVEGVIEQA